MAGPIKPGQIAEGKLKVFPDAVFDAFNELIVQKYSGGSATFSQQRVMELMLEKGLLRQDIISKGWLNVEEVYRDAGWSVEYDAPGYNESYPATFTFSNKK